MAMDIDVSFVKQYESEVHEAFQRQGSLLRNTVRAKQVMGTSTTFQKVGTGTATQKSRNGVVPPMNVDHDNVECFLQDWYAGDWFDKLDELKINHDERGAVVRAGAYALGRRTDAQIIAELNAAETGTSVNLSSFDIAAMTAWVTALGARDVPINFGEVFCLVSWPVWAKIMTFAQFSSGDYVGPDLPFKAPPSQVREWMGVLWMPHTGLSGASSARECHMYHRTVVGHAIGAEVTTDITWHGDRASWFINNMMSQGAKLIDANGVVTRVFNEGA